MNRRLEHRLGDEAVNSRLQGYITELCLTVGRTAADQRLPVTLLLGEVLADLFCRLGPITLRHTEIHQDQLVHWLGKLGIMALLNELNRFESIDTEVALDVELEEKAL